MEWLPSLAESPGVRRRRRGVMIAVAGAVVAALVAAGVAAVRVTSSTADAEIATSGDGETVYPVPPELTAIAAQVADVRGLALRDTVDARVTDPTTFADDVQRLALDPEVRQELAAQERLAKALGLVGLDVDLNALLTELYREQAIGLYAPEDQLLHVGSPDGRISPTVAWAVAHEAAHALQDQHFELGALLDLPPAQADESLALLAMVEGDAVVTQEVWSRRFQTEGERSGLSPVTGDPTVTAAGVVPRYIRESFIFPYEAGAEFVSAIIDQDGFAALDEVYESPPVSTEQILHPEKYRADEVPVAVTDVIKPGPGWQPELDQSFGEAHLRQMLRTLGEGPAARLAEGWGGGRLRTWTHGDDVAVSLVAVMDTQGDADQLCRGLPRWWEQVRAPGVKAQACDGLEVRLGVAPDEATANLLTTRVETP